VNGGRLTGREIAIVGFAFRLPSANTAAELWELLSAGREGIRRFTKEELLAAGVPRADFEHEEYVPAGGVVDGADLFDAKFFGFPTRLAQGLDPQQRLLLECAWEALEHAGCDPARVDGAIGVFAGQSQNAYFEHLSRVAPDVVRVLGERLARQSNDPHHLAGRVAYKLDLHGPAVTVLSACSTSLVATHLACQSLLTGESDVALAGGSSIRTPQEVGYFHDGGRITSPDGRCKAFDVGADGCVQSGGVAVVVLKTLAAALEAGDRVHAVIKGSATNNDGAAKVGYAAPSAAGQAAVIAEALAVAEVEPATIGYVETHGTGTPAGDPIEISALVDVLGDDGPPCPIGSIKTNIGHTDTAAGLAGLLKTVLALEHRRLPPSLNFRAPNPELPLGGSRLFVNAAPADWPANSAPRRAGVSSFGLGGTNAHVVLEEAPPREPSDPARPYELLVLSAKTPGALARRKHELAEFVAASAPDLGDLAFTLQLGRSELEHRWAAVCRGPAEAVERLRAPGDDGVASDAALVFVFPELEDPLGDFSADLVEAAPALAARREQGERLTRAVLGSTEAPPEIAALVAQVALARSLVEDWGLTPAAFLGVGRGRLAAAVTRGAVAPAVAIAALAGKTAPPDEPLPEVSVPVVANGETTALEEALALHGVSLPADEYEAEGSLAGIVVGRSCPPGVLGGASVVIALADDSGSGLERVLSTTGFAWLNGGAIEFGQQWKNRRQQKVAAPTYPFERVSVRPGPTAQPEVAMTTVESQPAAVEEVAAPPDPALEQALTEIFADLLGIPEAEVELETPFLDLGLDSLMLLQASRTIKERVGVDLPFRQLLRKYPTVRAVSAFATGSTGAQPTPPAASEAAPEPAPEPPPPPAPPPPLPVSAVEPVVEPTAPPPVPVTTDGHVRDAELYDVLELQARVLLEQLDVLRTVKAGSSS
jgi:acyl transferase domain-containing protein